MRLWFLLQLNLPVSSYLKFSGENLFWSVETAPLMKFAITIEFHTK